VSERGVETPSRVAAGPGSSGPAQIRVGHPDWVWLALSAAFLPFANGRDTLGLAAWLAPVFLVRFVRSRPAGSGLAVAYATLSVAWAFQFRGMAPLPPLGFVALALAFGGVALVPLAVDRLVAVRIQGFASTLALPGAWAVIDTLVARYSPYGSWGSPAYSQAGNLALLQLLSVVGRAGVTFLLGWFAAVANWIWERRADRAATGRGALTFAAVMIAVVIGGEVRLNLRSPSAPTVRIAALCAPDLDLFPNAETARRAFSGETFTADQYAAVRDLGWAIDSDLLQRSAREARAGAKVVFWAEASGFAFKEDEAELLDHGRELAKREGIYLGMAYAAWSQGASRPLENSLVLIGPGGEIAWRFLKAVPVPGPEAAVTVPGDRRLKVATTPYGRLSGAICFDMDFPVLLAQAGKLGVDVLMVPSGDWRAIDPFHTDMARFRAIEQGLNMVRAVNRGLSAAVDDRGQVLASMDYFAATDRTLVAQVPTRGVRTIYSRVGDTFAIVCGAGTIVVIGLAVRRRRPG
jgi:apolipoprotein N-acyltransferase